MISQNLVALDGARAMTELVDFVRAQQQPAHKCLLLECTNLPPYKHALSAATGLPVVDILTEIEIAAPGTIRPAFLAGGLGG